jgi:hypothetical protein
MKYSLKFPSQGLPKYTKIRIFWYKIYHPATLFFNRLTILWPDFQVMAFTSLGAIVVSTMCFILSTFPELQELVNILNK